MAILSDTTVDAGVKRCVVTDGILRLCPGLDRAVGGDYQSGRKGVTMMELYDFKAGKISRSGAVLRSGKIGNDGVIINYCPFCGTPIAEHFKQKEECDR